MYFIYILYSTGADKYYIGYTSDPIHRLEEHNSKPFNTFTSKYRPWSLAATFRCSEERNEAMQIEKWIKNQKSRKLLEKLCNPEYIPDGYLARLVRVPHVRD